MKHSLIAMLLMACSVGNVYAESETSFDYTLAYDYFTSLRNPSYIRGSQVYEAFVLSESNAKLYEGSEITSVNVTSGTYKDTKTNSIKNITVFLSYGLDEEPFYTQSAKLGDEGATMYKIDLDTPCLITGDKQLVIGYYFKISSDDVNYISVDGVSHESLDGGWVGNKVGNGDIVWSNVAGSYGNLCMGCTIKGSNLAQNGVSLLSMSGPEFVEPDSPFLYIIYFQNTATNEVTSMEVSYSVGGNNLKSEEVKLSEPLGYNQRKGLMFNNLVSESVGLDIPVQFEITKVNGVPNMSSEKSRYEFLNCFLAADGYKRVHLLEEGTGTWCQWCPAGIVMMERIKELYPDEYALVAVHYNDEMEVPSTRPVTNLFTGYPTAMIDRAVFIYPQKPEVDKQLQQYTDYYKEIPSFAGITTLEGEKTADGFLDVKTGLTFALDVLNNNRYTLSYYLVENQVGPYFQTNSEYSGGTVSMGGWENKPLSVFTLFDDVACLLEGDLSGIAGSIPSDLQKNKEYVYEAKLPLKNVTKDNVELIAFVVDNADGTIVNAFQTTVDLTTGAVGAIEDADDYYVEVAHGLVRVSGIFSSAKVFSLSGELLGQLDKEGEISLGAGIYIVVVDGSAKKIIVK